MERVGETGQARARIAQQVAQINGVVTEITASARFQAMAAPRFPDLIEKTSRFDLLQIDLGVLVRVRC